MQRDKKKDFWKNVKCYLESRNYNNFNIILIFLLFDDYSGLDLLFSLFLSFWFRLFKTRSNWWREKETDRNSIALIEFIFKWDTYENVYTQIREMIWNKLFVHYLMDALPCRQCHVMCQIQKQIWHEMLRETITILRIATAAEIEKMKNWN